MVHRGEVWKVERKVRRQREHMKGSKESINTAWLAGPNVTKKWGIPYLFATSNALCSIIKHLHIKRDLNHPSSGLLGCSCIRVKDCDTDKVSSDNGMWWTLRVVCEWIPWRVVIGWGRCTEERHGWTDCWVHLARLQDIPKWIRLPMLTVWSTSLGCEAHQSKSACPAADHMADDGDDDAWRRVQQMMSK